MRNMEKTMNKLSRTHKTQPVKFVDPMGGMMMGSDGWDEVLSLVGRICRLTHIMRAMVVKRQIKNKLAQATNDAN